MRVFLSGQAFSRLFGGFALFCGFVGCGRFAELVLTGECFYLIDVQISGFGDFFEILASSEHFGGRVNKRLFEVKKIVVAFFPEFGYFLV